MEAVIDNHSNLLLWAIFMPMIGSMAVYFVGTKYESARNILAAVLSGITFMLCAFIFLEALNEPFSWKFGLFLDYGLYLKADVWGSFMALVASFIWFLGMVYSITYMDHEHSRNRFYTFFLFTMGACVGVFLTGDLFSLFIFFEMMSLVSYVLVIHAQSDEAMSAGRNYLFLSVFGGLMLLVGVILLHAHTGSTAFTSMLADFSGHENLRLAIIIFLIIGFGIKAGMIPLHIWLPKAHPVAPSPASALLSGIMIKTGVYGIVRVINIIMTPDSDGAALWNVTQNLGLFIIWMAILTMFAGAIMALFQTNIKRVLAYSSISQMGYILMGVGCAAYLGFEGPMGFAGFSYHILNHAFFKAGMFMMVGAVYARTHELEFSRLGGLAKYFPVTMVAFAIAAAGISGVPGFNGYISKTLLHHAIEYVYQYSHSPYLHAAEKMFTITGALTVCYISRLFTSIFFGKTPDNIHDIKKEPASERVVFSVFAGAILLLGLFPQFILEKIIVPASGAFVFDSYKVDYLLKQNFINTTDLLGVIIPITAGIILMLLMKKFDIFRFRFPDWFSVEKVVYAPVVGGSLAIYGALGNMIEKLVDSAYVKSPAPLFEICTRISEFEKVSTPRLGRKISDSVAKTRDYVYGRWMDFIIGLTTNMNEAFLGGFKTLMNVDKKPAKGKQSVISLANLDFNLVIVIITLILVLGLAFILR